MKVKGLFDDIKKAYLGDKQLSQMNAFIGDVPVITGGSPAEVNYFWYKVDPSTETVNKADGSKHKTVYGYAEVSNDVYVPGYFNLQYRIKNANGTIVQDWTEGEWFEYSDSYEHVWRLPIGVSEIVNYSDGRVEETYVEVKGNNPQGFATDIDNFNLQMTFIGESVSSKTWQAYVNIGGNINTLLNGSDRNLVQLQDRALQYLFFWTSSDDNRKYGRLLNAEELLLPYNHLSDACYRNMFNGCKYLLTAPNIMPSRDLQNLHGVCVADNSYYRMFENCTSLLKGPEIPSVLDEDLSWYGVARYMTYYEMFHNCSNMESIGKWHGQSDNGYLNTDADWCCHSMFEGCSKLTHTEGYDRLIIPQIQVGYGGKSICNQLFKYCTSLSKVEFWQDEDSYSLDYHVPFVNGEYEFNAMFEHTQIEEGFHLYIENEASGFKHSFDWMFNDCKNLKSVQITSPVFGTSWRVEGTFNDTQNGIFYTNNAEIASKLNVPSTWTVQIID